MIGESYLLRGINQHKLKPFYWFLVTIFMAGSLQNLSWSFLLISTISCSMNCVTLRGFRCELRSFLPSASHCLTDSSLDGLKHQKWGFIRAMGRTLKWSRKRAWFTYSDFFKGKLYWYYSFRAHALLPQHSIHVLLCDRPFLSRSLSPSTSSTTQRTWYYPSFQGRNTIPEKSTGHTQGNLAENKRECKLKSFDSNWSLQDAIAEGKNRFE